MNLKPQVVVVLAAVLLFGNELPAEETGSIEGRVSDAETGAALVGATVVVENASRSAVTGPEGRFEIENLPVGVYQVVASCVGYKSRTEPGVQVHRGTAASLRLALATEPIVFEELVVAAERLAPRPRSTITDQQIRERGPNDVGAFLRTAPGMSAIRKGGSALDVVYRGFKAEQLNVQIDGGVRVDGACPNRMDPPTSHVQAEDLEKIELIKGPNAVRFGPALGGVINLAMTRPKQTDVFKLHTRLDAGYAGNSSGKRTRGYLFGSDRTFDFYLSGGVKDYGNYSDGDGEEVNSSFNTRDYSLKLGWKPDPAQRLQLSLRQSFARDVLYPALPMDADLDDTDIVALDYSRGLRRGPASRIAAKIYLSAVDHVMSNERKPNYGMVHAVTDAETRTVGGRAEVTLKALGGRLFLGTDYRDLFMEGTRTRDMVDVSKPDFFDIIWPDGRSRTTGFFGEFERSVSRRTGASLGLRMDRVATAADNPEASFATIYPGDLDRTDLNLTLSLGLAHSLSRQTDLSLSLGLGQRSPSITERYLYLLPVGLDPYDYLGNPEVDPEQNLQLDVEAAYHTERGYVNAGVFYSRLSDYISVRLSDAAASRTPNVLGVKQFFNIDQAYKYGGELEGGVRPLDQVLVRAQVAYALGENDDSGEPLPEMPPLEAILAVRYTGIQEQFWVELANRFVARQERISAEFGEAETPGYAVADLRAGTRLTSYVRLDLGIDNLLDKTYYEHLNRKSKSDGVPIGEAGRGFTVLMTVGN